MNISALLLRVTTAATVIAAPMTFAVSAQAETPTCFGQPATIVGTDDGDTIHGTPVMM